MATLVLAVGANVLSSSLGLTAAAAAGSFSAALGQSAIGAAASLLGGFIDNFIFGGFEDEVEAGPRLIEARYTGSSEGAPILEIFGNVRTSGQLIWATKFKEVITKETEKVGGKDGGGGKVTTTSYNYYVSLAVAICRGPVSSIRRIWADSVYIDQDKHNVKLYFGDATQGVDSIIETIQGAGNVPAYRGVAYIVIEDFQLNEFGNRVPNFNFEVVNTLPSDGIGSVESRVQAVTMIPASTEHGYDPEKVVDNSLNPDGSSGSTVNIQNEIGRTDWEESLNELQRVCPNCKSVVFVVAWMGDDLRMDKCKIRPRVEYQGASYTTSWVDPYGQTITYSGVTYKETDPAWIVNGIDRQNAVLMTQFVDETGNEGPAYGSSPNDGSVIRAIQDMKARGLEVIFYPFIMLDIADDNELDNPYDPGSFQPSYPWRGRITCDPAPGVAGTPELTAGLQAQVDAFFGSAQPNQFTRSDVTTTFGGTADDWGIRRMILHYAHICDMAGGVDAFIIGTEMRGATTLRSSIGSYPVVDKFVALASDIRSIVGAGTRISYSADWSEYFGHDPADGSGDFHFHLDPLWVSDDIDFIGIDNYQPYSDWRDGPDHLDRQAGWTTIYDLDYLKSNIEGGELYDWFYESAGASGNEASAGRIAQERLPISDGAYGKPWVFRAKDLRNWWKNDHYNRVGGVEVASPTAWVAESKPFMFTEAGTAAVDKSPNQPNVFLDPKSFESFRPYFSLGRRDDFIQRQYIRLIYDYWNPAEGNNEWSTTYSGWMIEWDRTHIWTWDARPYPAFPKRKDYWADARNWSENHWITGRMGFVDLRDLVEELCIRSGADPARIDASELEGTVQGFVVDRRMSARAALNQLMSTYRFSAVESGNNGGQIKFVHRNQESIVTILVEELVRAESQTSEDLYNLIRAQETDLPRVLSYNYLDIIGDYRQSVVEAKNRTTESTREESVNFAIVMNTAQAQGIVESILSEIWSGREKLDFILPPRYWYLEPGDVINFPIAGANATFRLVQVTKELMIQVSAVRMDESAFTVIPGTDREPIKPSVPIFVPVRLYLLELPLLTGAENPAAPWAAGAAEPWSGANIFSSTTTSNYTLNLALDARTTIGLTTAPLAEGPTEYFDRVAVLTVNLAFGSLQSLPETEVLNGGNLAALETSPNVWEVIQFQEATNVGGNQWQLRKLLRARGGTEHAMQPILGAGARFVLLGINSMAQLAFNSNQLGILTNLKYGPQTDPIDATTYRTEQFTTTGVGYTPYAPVHVRATRNYSDDDLDISWIRRTRYDGNWNNLVDVPLNEAAEQYTLKIFRGATLVRTVSVNNATTFKYTAAMQSTDAVNLDVHTINFTVEQINSIVGPGYPGAGSWQL